MASISYIDATCVYEGATTPAVSALSLDVQDGEFMVLVGPSGSGKSTALRMLAGLESVSSGEIRIDGDDLSQRAPKDRDIAMVFQSYALYPHMTVAQNMEYGLKLRGMPRASGRRR
jgi:multiple sugar transport system ATP-binding protein